MPLLNAKKRSNKALKPVGLHRQITRELRAVFPLALHHFRSPAKPRAQTEEHLIRASPKRDGLQ